MYLANGFVATVKEWWAGRERERDRLVLSLPLSGHTLTDTPRGDIDKESEPSKQEWGNCQAERVKGQCGHRVIVGRVTQCSRGRLHPRQLCPALGLGIRV